MRFETPLRRLHGQEGEPEPARLATITVEFPARYDLNAYSTAAHVKAKGKPARPSCPLCVLAALPDKPKSRPKGLAPRRNCPPARLADGRTVAEAFETRR